MTTTLLIYMAGDNDLYSFANRDLEIIKESSYNSDINIVVEYYPNEFIESSDTYRLSIKNGEIVDEKLIDNTNAGDPKFLNNFIEESTKAYPSDRVILIIWSHGSGVDDMDFYDKSSKREYYFVPKDEIEEIAVAFDDTAQDFLDNLELQKALSVSTNIDVVGFDTCLMGMLEIVYQLREQTSVVVASQYLEPASGWDYNRIINELDVEGGAIDIGQQLISFHDEYHTDDRQGVTQSALNSSAIDEVVRDLDIFAKSLREELKRGEIEKNRKDLQYTLSNSQFFSRKDYVDLVDFVQKVKSRLGYKSIESHANKLLKSLNSFVIANHTIGYQMENAHGVSIYFPNESRPFRETFEMYEKLDFARDCPNWVKLLKWYWI